MKVHELAKEIDIQSKDIIAFLQDKGVEVKAAQSVLEDEVAGMVRKKFSHTDSKTESAKTNTDAAESAPKAVEVAPKVAEAAPQIAATAPSAPKAESAVEDPTHKKKKNIIFVSNPHNSKMTDSQRTSSQGNADKRNHTVQNEAAHDVVKPIQLGPNQMINKATGKPMQMLERPVSKTAEIEAVVEKVVVQPVEDAKPEKVVEPVSTETPVVQPVQPTEEASSNQQRPQQSGDRPAYQQRPQQSGDRPAYQQRPQGDRPPYQQRPQGDRPPYQQNGERPAYQQRPQGDRPPYQQRPQGDRPPYQQNGERPAYQQRPQGDRPPYQQRPQGDRPPYQQNGDRPAYQQRPQGDRPPYQQRPQGDRPPYQQNGDRPPYQQRPQGDRPPYQQRPQGDRPPYQQNGDRPPYQQRPQGDRPPYQQRPQGDRPPYQQRPGQTGTYNNNRGTYQGNSAGGPGGNRFGNNTGGDYAQRSGNGTDNRFKKPVAGKSFTADAPLAGTEKHRDDEKRRISQEKDKRSKKDSAYGEDGFKGKGKPANKVGRFIKPDIKEEDKLKEVIKTIILPDVITIKELAEKMKLQPSAIVKKLFLQGRVVTVNQEIIYDDAEAIAIEYDVICEKEVKVDVIEELLKEDEEAEDELITRAPVICVMGHVDHGKTSLLDAIRKTNVTDREAGGITQHIGAYTVKIAEQKITFLDTPGHEAFTAMRMRGANATDIAILVVAADDGVMPQTIEAINHAKAAGIEIIVAVNKIDKPNANIDRVKQELTEYELISEDWGGSTVFAPVSAKTGEGIQQLLEMILLTAEMLELKANPKRKARGLVIEAELDKGRGPVATILVQKGTLRVGDFISAGSRHGKVRAMIDDKGKQVKEAGPSMPVEILGLNDVPFSGEIFIAHDSDKSAKTFAETFVSHGKEKKIEETKAKMSLDDLFSQIQEGNLKELNLIVKADAQGSVEAVKQSLLKLSNEEVVVKCIHGGVGAINESDVNLAATSQAIIIGFNVRPDTTAKATAAREGVDIRLYKVIYQAIEDVEAAMKGMLDPVFEEKVLGHAEIRQIFKASALGNIAGAYVMDGTFQRGCKVRVSREGKQIFEGELASLKRFKDDVKEVKTGYECGLVFNGFDQMQELDMVEAYTMVEVPR